MKILVIGDIHYKISNVIESDVFTKECIASVSSIKPDLVVILGDVLDRFSDVHLIPFVRATKFIEIISKMVKVYLLIGNHDRPNNADYLTEMHPFNALKNWNNVVVVDKVSQEEIQGLRFVFVPYVACGKFSDALNTIENPLLNTTAIFAHQEFYGAKMGFINSIHGDVWDLSFPLVISGHIHDFDILQPNIYYVGTPFQNAFNEVSRKTISLFTFSSPLNENINENNKQNEKEKEKEKVIFTHERIELAVLKKKMIHLKYEQLDTFVPPENYILKLVIEGTNAEIKTILKLQKTKEWINQGIKIAYKTRAELPETNTEIIYMNYLERLKIEIENDKDLIDLYQLIFH